MDLSSYASGAAGIPPTAPGSPSVGYPSGGNPQTGQVATSPGAYWFYQLQAEMDALLSAADLTPDADALTQLRSAVEILADTRITYQFGSTAPTPDRCHLATNGWQILPSGLIVQWGQATGVNNSGWTTVTYPIAFPTEILHLQCSATGQNYFAVAFSEITAHNVNTLTQCVINGNTAAPGAAVWWLAIGY